MSWSSALERHQHGASSSNPDFWEQFLADNPQVLHRLLADVYASVYGTDKPPTLDDLWAIMATPRFSVLPFGEAVYEILGTRSIRWLARQSGYSHVHLHYMTTGARPVITVNDLPSSMKRLEAVARALDVHPSYFVEWRRSWIMSLLDAAFTGNPSLSIGIFQRYAGFDENPRENGRSRG